MNLDVTKWGQFRISDLFPILQNGKANQGMLSDGNDCFYVGAKKDDNGVMLHCAYDEELIQKGNCIIFICNGQGSVGYANYMDVDFIGTTDIVAGYNENLNEYNGLFIATILCQERPKYSFGRKWKTHLRDTIIKLPQTKENLPDWNFMEQYIKSLRYKEISTSNKSSNIPILDMNEWKKFKVSKILTCESTKLSIKDNLSEGTIPFISRSATNNGCDGYVEVDEDQTTKRNCITVGAEGIYTFYQPVDFATGNKVYQLRNEHMNQYIGLFISTILNIEDYRYSYGRARILAKLKDEIIKLPIIHNEDGSPVIDETYQYSEKGYIPDWQWMEDYIKSLPYGDRI